MSIFGKRDFLIIFSFFLVIVYLGFFPVQAAQTKQAQNSLDAYAPFEEFIAITTSDSVVYSPPLRGCIVSTAGTLSVLPTKNSSATGAFSVVQGQTIPIMISKVMATGTTAVLWCGR